MRTFKTIALIVASLFITESVSAQKLYKEMMQDPSYNFYEVCKEADKHFSENGMGKGSGYKGYQRWKNENESRYAPSGNRSNVDPRFVEKAYRKFLASQNTTERGSRSVFNGNWVDLGPYDLDSFT
jgi:hypothetical protein